MNHGYSRVSVDGPMLKRGPAPHQLSLNDMIIARVDDYWGDRRPLPRQEDIHAKPTMIGAMIDARYSYSSGISLMAAAHCAKTPKPPFDVNEPFRGERVLYKSSRNPCFRERNSIGHKSVDKSS